MMIVGLTGGIGSGKSTVADLFAKHHVPIIDADHIARDLTQPNQEALQQIAIHFGSHILNRDGTLDRRQLRTLIFGDMTARRWLESLLHPLIRDEIERKIKLLSAAYCIAVIPLLLEVGSYPFINRILVIDTDPDLQIERVTKRDHVIAADVHATINAQINFNERLAQADDIITNRGNINKLIEQVDLLHEKYINLSNQFC
jgi:dephospho-CoA kinase